MADAPGRLSAALADRYRIERELGEGGMATVYLAEDLRHHRPVAIKVLRPELAATLGPQRFMQEIEIAARLQHPHILPVHDSGEAGGFLFYVMPYVQGESLRERLTKHGELPIHEAVRILIEVADALAYAHAQHVVHRDIKPENIMLSGRHALVMDFGVAKAVSEATGRNKLTTAGVALGTPAYMSPEQASADPNLDQRVDIYALGVLGYELLSGRPPFTGGTPQQILAAQVTTPPEPLTRRRPTVSPALAAVIMKALEKRPADRLQTADEMLAQLEPLATPSGGTTPAETRPTSAVAGSRRQWLFLGVAGVVVVVLVAFAITLGRRPPPVAALGKATRVTLSAGVQEAPRVTPDGRGVAYALLSAVDSVERVEFRRAGGGGAVRLGTNSRPLAWSSDGGRLLMVTPRGLESVPELGGPARLLVPGAVDGTWSPHDHRIAFVRGDSLLVRDPTGRDTLLAIAPSRPYLPAWSPDGRWIAYASGNEQWVDNWNIAPSALWLVPATGGSPIRLTDGTAMDQSPVWAPDSRRILFVSNRNGTRDIYQLDLAGDGHPSGKPIQLTHGLNASLISLTPDGRTLAYSVATDHSNIWSIPMPATGWVSSRDATLVTTDRERIESFDITRDGKWLVFDSDRSGLQQIFRRPVAGGEVQQITRDTVPAFSPSVSPDGSEVAYHVIIGGLRRVFVTATDGSGIPVQVSPGRPVNEYTADWSPDGKHLVWSEGPFNRPAPDAFATRTGRTWSKAQIIRPDVPGYAMDPVWVNDSSLLATDSVGHAVIVPVVGTGHHRVRPLAPSESVWRFGQPSLPSLSKDGRWLLTSYTVERNGRQQSGILGISLLDGRLRDLLHFDDPLHPHRSNLHNIAEQGGRLYFTLGSPEASVWTVPITGLGK